MTLAGFLPSTELAAGPLCADEAVGAFLVVARLLADFVLYDADRTKGVLVRSSSSSSVLIMSMHSSCSH